MHASATVAIFPRSSRLKKRGRQNKLQIVGKMLTIVFLFVCSKGSKRVNFQPWPSYREKGRKNKEGGHPTEEYVQSRIAWLATVVKRKAL